MGVHKFRSKAIRFNGFTDGIVVPTGQFKESGVDLLGPAYDAVSGTNANTRIRIDCEFTIYIQNTWL